MNLDETVIHYRKNLCAQYLTRATGILHLGAHLGMEAASYAELGKPVLWVEALPDIEAQLARRLAAFPGQRSLCALLGDKDGDLTCFHISNNSGGVSSSIFDFGRFGAGDQTLWPDLGLKMVGQVSLPMVRLDSLLGAKGIDPARFDYWVVDLQGAEKIALEGAGNALKSCKALLVEVSTAEVYRDGVLWPELSAWLDEQGFLPLWEPIKQHDDVLFIRKSDKNAVISAFHSDSYLRHNQRRLEHLASLGLDLFGRTVLEVGAGVGDHTSFYLDRDCEVLTTDARPENVLAMKERFAGNRKVTVGTLDLNQPAPLGRKFEVVHCYGLLYHLQKPGQALEFMCKHCAALLVLETCVSYGDGVRINPVTEPSHEFSQAFNGVGCRPTRPWVMQLLARFMPHVYVTRTQPAHPEFPLDWSKQDNDIRQLKRAVFVASRRPLDDNRMLLRKLPARQTRR